jgi:serine/threonine protein kinase
VKRYKAGWADDTSKLIVQEVFFLDTLRSPHVVELVDAYRDLVKDCYIVMERLSCLVERLPTQPWETRLAMRHLLSGLAFVHSREVLHLDIKPANLGVTVMRNNIVNLKLLDFGNAAFRRQLPRKLTSVGVVEVAVFFQRRVQSCMRVWKPPLPYVHGLRALPPPSPATAVSIFGGLFLRAISLFSGAFVFFYDISDHLPLPMTTVSIASGSVLHAISFLF